MSSMNVHRSVANPGYFAAMSDPNSTSMVARVACCWKKVKKSGTSSQPSSAEDAHASSRLRFKTLNILSSRAGNAGPVQCCRTCTI